MDSSVSSGFTNFACIFYLLKCYYTLSVLDVQLDMWLEVGGGLDTSSSLSIMCGYTSNPTSSQISTTPPTTSGHTSITSSTTNTTIPTDTSITPNTTNTTNTSTSQPLQPVEVI